MAIALTRTDYDAAGLRQAASQSKDSDAIRRILALALVLEGRSRAKAAEICGMDRRPCVIGFIVSVMRGCQDCLTVSRRVPNPVCRQSSRKNCRNLSDLARPG